MRRRQFIEKSFTGSLALLSLSGSEFISRTKYPMGLQLFTVREDMEKDPLGTLKAAKTLGYEDFEVYGFDAENMTYYGYSPSEFRSVLEDLTLTVSSGHYGFSPYLNKPLDSMRDFVDACIKGAQGIGSKYITWPWIAPEQRTPDNYRLMALRLNQIGEQVKEAGLGFAYHNHGFEFEDHNGKTGMDIILRETDPSLVKLQMDMYWVMHSSSNTPKELVRQQPGRYVMWHIKDMDKVTRDYSELGNGSINYSEILPDPETSGLEYYYLEQGGNFAKSPMESIAESARYFRKHLQKRL